MNHEELKPCPFCGENAELDRQRGYRELGGHLRNCVAIYCTACQADMALYKEDMPPEMDIDELASRLTKMWNNRRGTNSG